MPSGMAMETTTTLQLHLQSRAATTTITIKMSQQPRGHRSHQSPGGAGFATPPLRAGGGPAPRTPTSPCPTEPLPDLVHRPAPELDVGKRGQHARRSLAEMQLGMIKQGAFFFEFEEPDEAPNGEEIVKDEKYLKGLADYRTMEKQGYLVTRDGCMFPHEQYGRRGEGSTNKGYQRSTFFLTGKLPEREAEGVNCGTGGKRKKLPPVPRDEAGLPMDAQVSHLCHRPACIRGDHLQIEPRCRNIRRNMCGILKTGKCDCGMWPPCVRNYHPADWDDPGLKDLCRNQQEVLDVLAPLKEKFPFKLLESQSVRREAIKSENARRRKTAARKNLEKTEQNLAKRSRIDV